MEFNYNGKLIILTKLESEEYDLFLERGNIIIKNLNNIFNYKELVMLSHIYINYTYKHCIYPNNLLEKIKLLVL
tara:strand:+ start:993 stop:1214 length:222 start_codon:yes stop_codon:yes gene_type:complete